MSLVSPTEHSDSVEAAFLEPTPAPDPAPVIHVLLIEDNPADARLIQHQLKRVKTGRFTVDWVERLSKGLERLAAGGIDVALLDLDLPDSQGLKTFVTVHQRMCHMPVVVMSGLDDESVALAAVQKGAQDYLVKGKLGGDLLVRALRHAIERARTERELRRGERRLAEAQQFQKIFETGIVAVSITRLDDGTYVAVNDQFVKDTGYRRDQVIGKTPRELNLWVDPDALPTLMGELRNHGAVNNFETCFRMSGGANKTGVISSAVIEFAGEPHVVSFMRDITEQKRLEEHLLHAQKMEAIGRLAGGMAHDLNNLLTLIQGSVYLAKRTLPPDHSAQRNLGAIEAAAGRTADLTRQLLAFARRQVIEPKVVDLNEVITKLRELLARLIGENLELMTISSADPALVRIDRGQIEQVLVNLAVNARDAMPRGGKLVIEIEGVSIAGEADWLFDQTTSGEHALLIVRDTGTGMTDDVKAHLFEPFFTTKELGRGTGLGLATCYGIITQNGGHITVESAPGAGTTFRIYLPRCKGEADVLVEAPADTGVLPGGSETILVVEDDAATRELMIRILRDGGYEVVGAANGYHALSLAAGRIGPIHLLLSDVVMPQIGGMQTADLLRTLLPTVRVLLVSGYTDLSIADYMEARKEIFFLPKPFTPEVLTRRVREILDARR